MLMWLESYGSIFSFRVHEIFGCAAYLGCETTVFSVSTSFHSMRVPEAHFIISRRCCESLIISLARVVFERKRLPSHARRPCSTRPPQLSNIDEPPRPLISMVRMRNEISAIVRQQRVVVADRPRKILHCTSLMIHNEPLGLRIYWDVSPSKELANTLHDISTAQRRARDRMFQNWTDDHDVPDLIDGRPVYASACFDEFADHLVADIATFRFRHNPQIV